MLDVDIGIEFDEMATNKTVVMDTSSIFDKRVVLDIDIGIDSDTIPAKRNCRDRCDFDI